MPNNWLESVKQLAAVKAAGFIDCEPIKQGITNHNFKVTTEQGVWVVRLNQPQPGVDREREQQLLCWLAPLNLTAKIIDINPAQGFLITEYLNSQLWTQKDFEDAAQLQSLADKLKLIHQISYDEPTTRLDHRILQYIDHFKPSQKICKRLMADISSLEQSGFWAACTQLYHSDLHRNNILGIGDDIKILDWEYAGQGHAILDWLIMEQESGSDLSHHYPQETNPKWLPPLRSLIQQVLQMWPTER